MYVRSLNWIFYKPPSIGMIWTWFPVLQSMAGFFRSLALDHIICWTITLLNNRKKWLKLKTTGKFQIDLAVWVVFDIEISSKRDHIEREEMENNASVFALQACVNCLEII